ncbi:MAG: DUF349 domain-containing protein [Cyclobacteriaceae bacterium]
MIEDMENDNQKPEVPAIPETVQQEAELTNSVEESKENEPKVQSEDKLTAPNEESDNVVTEESSEPVEAAKEEQLEEEVKESPTEPVSEKDLLEDGAEIETIASVSEESKEEISKTDEIGEVEVAAEVSSDDDKMADDASDESKASGEDHPEEEEHDDHQEEELDFENSTKEELVNFIVEIKNEEDMRRVDRILKQIRPRFDELFNAERQVALEEFLKEEGAVEEDFVFKGNEEDVRFNDYYNLLREKRNKYFNGLEKAKDENLKRKTELLDKIRELVDGEESTSSIKSIKDIQEEWRNIGPVPPGQNKMLWANYNALLDRYYDARSIYFELKELDRKKNLKIKATLCEKAEQLDSLDNLKDAIVQLNELHEEYKHAGPVPREEQEQLWLRFKAASDKIYAKRKGFVEDLKKELQDNLEKKMTLAKEVQTFVDFNSDRITEWNKKTKEIQEVQKRWDAIGGMPREKAKEVNKLFWGSFKKFFANKSNFFKGFESQREDNQKKKEELIARAEELMTSTDWEATANALKKLQGEWREIGPVPEKVKNEIYDKFKKACDQFFNNRRSQNNEQQKQFEDNLTQKHEICDKIDALGKGDEVDQDALYDLVDAFAEVGFVPRNAIKKIQKRFDGVVDAVLGRFDEETQREIKMNIRVNQIKSSPHGDRKAHRQEHSLRRRIQELEGDVNTWKTNLEFFASSKTADKLKKEFEQKIEDASDELNRLKQELKILRNS